MHEWTGAEGLSIAGDIWGNPDAPLVALLHGGGQTRHAWKGVGQALGEAGFRAVALDARGHGDSGWSPSGDYSTDAMVEDLRLVVSALGANRVALVGASMGGGVSLVAAGENAVDASAVVLVDMAPKVEMEGVIKIQEFMMRRPDGFATLEEVAESIASYQPHRPRKHDHTGLAKNVRLGIDGRFKWHWDPRFLPSPEEVQARGKRFEDCAGQISAPMLLVRGGLSDVVSEEGARSFLELCPHAEYVNVGGAGHMVAGDRNDVFGQAVKEFLARKWPR
jgi:pimeloyl-ACP methyl ester carboxylesterase